MLVNNDYEFEKFCNITPQTLEKYVPRKAKDARANQMPFNTKGLSKNIMKKSRPRNNYLKIMKKMGNCTRNKEIIASLY